jgi:DNA-binding transcriptional ArsR family regulator
VPCSEAAGAALGGEPASDENPQRIADKLAAEGMVRHIAALIFTLHKGLALEIELRRAMAGGRYPIDSRLARATLFELQEKGLVELVRIGKYKVYRLTEKGREVAEELARRVGLA